MGLVNRKAAQAVKKEVSTNYTGRIATAFYCMMNNFHSLDVFDDYEIEKLLLKQQELDTEDIKNREPRRTDIVTFMHDLLIIRFLIVLLVLLLKIGKIL